MKYVRFFFPGWWIMVEKAGRTWKVWANYMIIIAANCASNFPWKNWIIIKMNVKIVFHLSISMKGILRQNWLIKSLLVDGGHYLW